MTSLPSSRAGRALSCCALFLSVSLLGGCQSAFFPSWSPTTALFSDSFAQWSASTAVNDLAGAIAAENAERIRQVTSADFSASLLAGKDPFDNIENVWPVEGELQVVAIEEVPANEWKNPEVPEEMVTIKDERGWETYGRLVRDPQTEDWVVDEILITSQQRGISVTKTISEQLAFERVVQDFASAWQEGDRKARLVNVTPACRKELAALPDSVLDHVAGQMFPPGAPTINIERAMDEDIAIVRLRHPSGVVVLEMKRVQGDWLIDDAAFKSGTEGETIPSLRNTAIAYAAATDFLRAYAAADLEALEAVTVEPFFDATLKLADLSTVKLPPVSAAKTGRLRLITGTGELIITTKAKTFKIALTQTSRKSHALSGTEFRVEDVTIYSNDGRHKKTLAAALVAEPMARLFVKALVNRNLNRIKAMSTHDFCVNVWSKVRDDLMPELPLMIFDSGECQMLSVLHKGETTEVTMLQAGRAMTVVLHDESGEIKIDDVIVAVADRPSSTKTALTQYLPVARMVQALKQGDLGEIRDQCTRDFNYSIWSQIRKVPPVAQDAVAYLDGSLRSLKSTPRQAIVKLGRPGRGSTISMLMFEGQWKINDITLVTGKDPSQQLALKDTLRHRLANGKLDDSQPLLAGVTEPSTSKPATDEAGGPIETVAYETPVIAQAAGMKPPVSQPPNSPSHDAQQQPQPVPLSEQGEPDVTLSPIPPAPSPTPSEPNPASEPVVPVTQKPVAQKSAPATPSALSLRDPVAPEATLPKSPSTKSANTKTTTTKATKADAPTALAKTGLAKAMSKSKPPIAAIGPAAPFDAPLW